jgi:AraC-like DNA-binding protein
MPDHELILVTGGRLVLIEDGQRRELVAGDWLVLHPGVPHAGGAPYDRETAFMWIHFDPPAAGGGLDLPAHGHAPRPERAQDLARRLLDECERPGSPPVLRSHLFAALCAELACANAEEAVDGDGLADRAQRLITLRFAENLSTADIAGELGCHPDHLTRAYRQRFGHPPLEGLHRRRIAWARRRLTDSAASQDCIAADCGYADARHFRRWFLRLAGVTPGAWRRLHGRVHVITE